MKKLFFLFFIVVFLVGGEKIFVVERENSALAVIKNLKLKNEIKKLHNFNHAVVKFYDRDGYIITRDGYLIKFDPLKETKIKEIKASDSAIGFTLAKDFVAVANYANKTVEIFDRDLNLLQSFNTGSKNVGIKTYKNYLVFACMDNDEIWVLKKLSSAKAKFRIFKIFKNVGEVPFDAMINDNLYVVGFFNSPFVGVLDLDKMLYKKVALKMETKGRVLKVPHFGFWSIMKDKFFIPAVGNKKVFVFDKEFNYIKTLKVEGNPVFTSLSPKRDLLAVTFSGKKFPFLQIVDTKKLKVLKRFNFGGMILHIRWSKENPYLYVANNKNSEVIVLNTNSWKILKKIKVPKPSGIFIFKE